MNSLFEDICERNNLENPTEFLLLKTDNDVNNWINKYKLADIDSNNLINIWAEHKKTIDALIFKDLENLFDECETVFGFDRVMRTNYDDLIEVIDYLEIGTVETIKHIWKTYHDRCSNNFDLRKQYVEYVYCGYDLRINFDQFITFKTMNDLNLWLDCVMPANIYGTIFRRRYREIWIIYNKRNERSQLCNVM